MRTWVNVALRTAAVQVEDSLAGGRGAGRVSLLSAIPAGGDRDRPEINAGTLHRYLAEAVWYPAALIPSACVQWTAIDETTARATLTDHGIAVSLDFRVGESGEIISIFTPARWGQFAEGYRQVSWQGHFGTTASSRG